jgi:magnesium transporter
VDESAVSQPTVDDLREVWPILDLEERLEGFSSLSREDATDFFLSLPPDSQAEILRSRPPVGRRVWLRLLAPDDVADVLQVFALEEREGLLALIDNPTRSEVIALLAYAEDQAGGLMSPRFARVRPEMTVDDAIRYVRRQARDQLETVYYVYVIDAEQRLLGVVSFRELLTAPEQKLVRDVMHSEVVCVPADMDDEAVAKVIAEHDLLAVPVVDATGRIKGIVTMDDIVDVVQSEATEDIQKLGGQEALEEPYMQTGFVPMLQKRAGWLAVLFVGEMLTSSTMLHYEDELKRAIVLASFVPLILSSGGNSGSQASTLVIRAMALGEVRVRDWWRVVRREIGTGVSLGVALALIGALTLTVRQLIFHTYSREQFNGVLFAVCGTLVGVVAFGTVVGSMLPMALRRLGFDPASASAPLIATIVDVTGLVIYFNVAALLLRGLLL